ncbi:hypothetical protein COBT_000073 [Conglomerata obtusa]
MASTVDRNTAQKNVSSPPSEKESTHAPTVTSKKMNATDSVHSKEPEVHTFKKKSFKGLQPIAGSNLVEVDPDDVVYYLQHADEYKVQKGERLIPYIIRMNERYKSQVESRIKNRRFKRGMTVFFILFGLLIAVVVIVFGISKFIKK